VKHGRIGRYELLHKIAAGGMAEIFLARQWGQGGFFRDVVIKRLFPHYAEHERALRMFQDEARLLSELAHPNIPQVYDLGYADGYWYLAMEHVRGVSLADLCRAAAKANKPMPLAVAIGIVHQVSMALHHAHEKHDREGRALRIVHRDVTPHNIMLSLDAVVKVLDFGVAQTTARVDTDAGAVRGTYAYMGPEQVRGRPLDKRADVFALGVILYELTTGRRLFRGSDIQVMTQIVEQDVPAPSSLLPNYPGELEQVVTAALARDRGRRTPSAAHLALTLDQFCMRAGLVTGPLVIAHYVRTLFPYERVNEEGMGIAQVPPSTRPGREPASDRPAASMPALSAEELEERLLAEELRELQQRRTQHGEPIEDHQNETDLEELSADDLLLDEPVTQEGPPLEQEQASMRIDEVDDDSEIKPVVLLSPRRKTAEGSKSSDGAFMSDLERRLREDAEG
jgi:serine/threonine-protein kinase